MLLDHGTPDTPPTYRIESVDKALRLLWLLRDERELTVTRASEHLGVARSTAHRLLAMLQYHGFARQDPTTKAYAPGRGLLEIGLAAVDSLDIRRIARPELGALSREVRETVQLIILEGSRTLVLDAVEADEVVRVSARTGGSMPPHCVSAGKVLLARQPVEYVRALLGPDPLEKRTPESISTLAELERELEVVRTQGHATNIEESEPGVFAVSVAIPVPPGVTPAAITVVAPSMRMSLRRIPGIVTAAHAAAKRIAEQLDGAT